MQLTDPVTGRLLTIYGEKNGEVYRVGTQLTVGNLIHNLAHANKVDEEEMVRRLCDSNPDNPIKYYDEVYWCE